MSARSRSPFDPYQVSENGLYLRDNTLANVSTAKHGLTPKLPNDSNKFLDGTGAWSTIIGTGSVTAKYSRWDPLVPDTSPHADTEEFGSSSLGAFTIVNTRGTVDADTTAKHKLFMGVADQQFKWVCALKAIPGSLATVHTIVHHNARTNTGLISSAGIVFSSTNTTNTGSQVMYGTVRENSALERGATYWSNFGQTASGSAFAQRSVQGGTRMHVRARLVAGSWTIGWSEDGESWFNAIVAPGFTVNYVGLGVMNYSASDAEYAFEFLRFYTTDTPRTGGAVTVYG